MTANEVTMVFNDGIGATDQSSIEHRIFDSLAYERGDVDLRDLKCLAGKIAFVIRFKLGAHIPAAHITILVKMFNEDWYNITIWAHLAPMCLQELFTAEGGSGLEAIKNLEQLADRAVEQVMRLKDASSVRVTPLMEQLEEDIGLLEAATRMH